MGRFSDDDDFLPSGALMPEPRSARGLLVDLRLESAPRKQQEAGIEAWLKARTPSEALRRSLKRFGYGPPAV